MLVIPKSLYPSFKIDMGYVVLRFYSNNPGWWFFHCHYDFHSGNGMMMILNEKPKDKAVFDGWMPKDWKEKMACDSWMQQDWDIISKALDLDPGEM